MYSIEIIDAVLAVGFIVLFEIANDKMLSLTTKFATFYTIVTPVVFVAASQFIAPTSSSLLCRPSTLRHLNSVSMNLSTETLITEPPVPITTLVVRFWLIVA